MKLLKSKISLPLSVKELLLENVGGMEPARSVNTLHASDLTKQEPVFCPREFYLHRVLDRKRADQRVAHAMRVTWDEGRDKQWRLNNVYLRDVMWGHWRCTKCDELAMWQLCPEDQHPTPCVKGAHRWEYEEVAFTHPSGFSGSLDGVVQFTPAKRRMLEVKIMKADDFKALKAPLAEHRIRTQLYLRTIAETTSNKSATIDTEVAHILYVMRGHGVLEKVPGGQVSPFKEYQVKRDDAAVEKYVRMATALRDGVPEGVCTTALCARASACAVSKECFSGKYPASHVWSKS